jgi:hypothetical protein
MEGANLWSMTISLKVIASTEVDTLDNVDVYIPFFHKTLLHLSFNKFAKSGLQQPLQLFWFIFREKLMVILSMLWLMEIPQMTSKQYKVNNIPINSLNGLSNRKPTRSNCSFDFLIISWTILCLGALLFHLLVGKFLRFGSCRCIRLHAWFLRNTEFFCIQLGHNCNRFHSCEIVFIFLMSNYVTFDFIIKVNQIFNWCIIWSVYIVMKKMLVASIFLQYV